MYEIVAVGVVIIMSAVLERGFTIEGTVGIYSAESEAHPLT